MRKAIIGLLLAASIFIAGYLSGNIRTTGEIINEDEKYTWTRAFCNNEGLCVDAEITCFNKEVIRISPIDGGVYHNPGWKDPRGYSPLC